MTGPSKKKNMKTHRVNLVHACVDVNEFYDRNVFDKHRLMQKRSQFYVVRSLIYKAEVFLKIYREFYF